MKTLPKLLSAFLFFILCNLSFANAQQTDTLQRQEKGLQISLLTCGPGTEIYSVFGHTAVRIIDSNTGSDIVYNYGTFDGYDEHFEQKFMQGKLLYYLSEDNYGDFIDFYGDEGRWVKEQLLNTTQAENKMIQDFLLTNLLPENRAYKYDFFFDNCATRIRDIFTKTHGDAFQYPNVLPPGKSLSFRDIINRYLANNVWERFGINILLGSKIDKKMSNAEIMFLPDYLSDGVGGASFNGKPYAAPSKPVVTGEKSVAQTDYSVLLVLFGLLVLLSAGLFIPRLKMLGTIVSNFILILSGLLGVLILVMWFATDHQTCSNNYNLLWALPTNLLFLFRKKQYKYASITIVMIFISLLLHVAKIQCLLLPEMIPVLLMLLFIFGTNYKKYKHLADAKNTIAA